MDLFSIDESKEETSFLRQAFVGMADVILALLVVIFLLIYQLPLYKFLSDINSILLVVIFLIIYRLISFLCFGRTIGMKIFNVILLNGEEQPLSLKEKILASIFILYKGVGYHNN